MSKKYIYFKCAAEPDTGFAKDLLTRMELSDFENETKELNTIFQLMDNPDLKLVISKDLKLQRLLSVGLAGSGNHGYLWSGEFLPPQTEKILFESVLIENIFIFQRNTDPEPDILENTYTRLGQKLEIYNWWVFVLPGFFKTYQQVLALRLSCDSEALFDKHLQRYLDRPFAQQTSGPEKVRSILFDHPDNFALLQQVLFNFLKPQYYLEKELPCPGLFTVLSGKQLLYTQPLINSSGCSCQLFGNLVDLDLGLFQKAADSILSSIRLLLSSSAVSQTDLFVDPLGKDFLSVWQMEKERLETARIGLSELNLKAFAVTKFLLKRKLAGGQQLIAQLLECAFRNALTQLLNRRTNLDLISVFQKALRVLQFDLHVFHKLKSLGERTIRPWIFHSTSQEINNINQGSLLFTPGDGYIQKMDKAAVQLNRLLNPNISVLPAAGFDDQTIWHDEIGIQGELFQRTGRSGKYLFQRLYSQNLEREAVILFWHWMQVDRFLRKAITFTDPGVRLCLILPKIAVQENYLSVAEIVKESLQAEDLSQAFQIEHVLDPIDDPAQKMAEIVILIRKQDGNVL